jgi:hypothetical protein
MGLRSLRQNRGPERRSLNVSPAREGWERKKGESLGAP